MVELTQLLEALLVELKKLGNDQRSVDLQMAVIRCLDQIKSMTYDGAQPIIIRQVLDTGLKVFTNGGFAQVILEFPIQGGSIATIILDVESYILMSQAMDARKSLLALVPQQAVAEVKAKNWLARLWG